MMLKRIMPIKSWLVIGPGRTGSFTIVRCIYFLYNYDYSIMARYSPNDPVRPIKPFDVIHTHDLGWLDEATVNTEVIISTRNPIESALSWCIVPEIGSYHFKRADMEKLNSLKIKKFYLDPDKFLSVYNDIVNFYKKLKVKDSYHILDYADWSNDPTQILRKINYNVDVPIQVLNLKNPGLHSDWIENWDEISEKCKSLSKNAKDLIQS